MPARKARHSRATYQRAQGLIRYLGSAAGVRVSASDVARELPTLDRRTPRTKELVQTMMDEFTAAGLAEEALGPRGGKGWALTPKGQALIDDVYRDRRPSPPKAEPATGHQVGYARVSTRDQNPDLQLDALRQAGCERIFEEKASGAQRDRPELTAALDYIRPGDTLVVWKLDRLARSLKQLLETVEDLDARGIGFRSLTEAIDTTTPGGRLVFHLFAALAEFERSLIRERIAAGLEAAQARGRFAGRPPALSTDDLTAAKAMLRDPKITVEKVAKQLGVAPSTLYRHLPGGRSQVEQDSS